MSDAQVPATLNFQDGSNLEGLYRLASAVAKAKYFGVKSPEEALIKIVLGVELGIGHIQALTGIYTFDDKGGNTKTAFSSTLINALLKRAGYSVVALEHTDKVCRLGFSKECKSVGESSFSLEDATIAGITRNPTWAKYPKDMLFARALTRGARWYCAEAFNGMPAYTPEELEEDAQEPQRVEVVSPAPKVIEQDPDSWRDEVTEAFPDAKKMTYVYDISEVPDAKKIDAATLLQKHGATCLPDSPMIWESPVEISQLVRRLVERRSEEL